MATVFTNRISLSNTPELCVVLQSSDYHRQQSQKGFEGCVCSNTLIGLGPKLKHSHRNTYAVKLLAVSLAQFWSGLASTFADNAQGYSVVTTDQETLSKVRGDVSSLGVGDSSCAVLAGLRARRRFLVHFINLYRYSPRGSLFLYLVVSCGYEGLYLCFQFPVCGGDSYAINSQ